MANHVLLNNVEHKDLKIRQDFSGDFGENMMCAPVYPVEARHAQASYPLVFAKTADGEFQMVALFGFEQGENLFVNNGQWEAAYRPLVIEKGPFLIGRNDASAETLSIHVDMDDARVNTNDGQPVFLPHGGNTDYIDNMANVLSTLHQSQEKHREFVAQCEALSLIESFVMDIDLDGKGTHRLAGFYTINEEKLQELDGDTLDKLHKARHLEVIYMMLASMSQFRALVERKKARAGA
ncbi:SapC family protein [Alteromonas sp. CYL-A6]|uniref:SapC family protein n=1 Tax=Alteromonas nitratireducens TaxID=3390813 RepID=UPI0034A86DE8